MRGWCDRWKGTFTQKVEDTGSLLIVSHDFQATELKDFRNRGWAGGWINKKHLQNVIKISVWRNEQLDPGLGFLQ